MNPTELNSFIERVYHAGPEDPNARMEILTFSKRPDALESIINAINANALSKISLLVALSMIPHTNTPGPGEMENLRLWFKRFVGSQAGLLNSDPQLLAMIESVFLFCFEGAMKEGATLIQDLSVDGPSQRLLACRVSRLIIETVRTTNVLYLVPVAVESLKCPDSSGDLVEASFQLLLSVLRKKEAQHQHRLAIVKTVCGEIGVHNLVSFIYRCGEVVETGILRFLTELVGFPHSAFPEDGMRDEIIKTVMNEVSTLIKKKAIHVDSFQALASLCVAVRKSVDWKEQSIVGKFVEQIGKLTEMLLEPANLAANCAPAEFILDFWCDKDNWGYRTGTVWSLGRQEKEFVGKLLGIFQSLFFSPDSLSNGELIGKIVSDESSRLASKIAKISELDSDAYAAMVFQSLTKFTELKAVVNTAFCIEFIGDAVHNASLSPRLPEIMKAVQGVLNGFPSLGASMYSDANVALEMALIHLYGSLISCFLKSSVGDLFIQDYGDVIVAFYIRFLSDIQCPEAPVTLVNAVIELLRFDHFSKKYLELLASSPEIFNLVSTSQVVRSDMGQSKSETRLFFSALFMLGYALREPTKAIELVNAIERCFFEQQSLGAFAMLSGCFLPPNCPFSFMFNGVSKTFFPKLAELLAQNNTTIVKPLLDLLLCIVKTPSLANLPVMSPPVVAAFSKIFEILKATKLVIGSIDKSDVLFGKSVIRLMKVLSACLTCKALNIGILSVYDKDSKDRLSEIIVECFNLLLLIPFPVFLEQSTLLNTYKEFICTIFHEDAALFVDLSDVLLQHQLFFFAHLLEQEPKSFIEIGCDLVSSMLSDCDPEQLANIASRQNSHPMNTVVTQLFNFVFAKGLKFSSLIKSLRCVFLRLPSQFNSLTETLMSRFDVSNQPKVRNMFEYLRSKLELQETTPAELAVKDALVKIVSFAKDTGADLSL